MKKAASINQKTLKKQAKNMQNEQRFVGEKQQTEKQPNGEKTDREFVLGRVHLTTESLMT